jgi:PAS domain S-box-containing protein
MRPPSPVDHSPFVLRLAGAAVAVAGALVLVSWHAHWTAVLQPAPGAVAMKYNTAICFILCGVGAFTLASRRPRWAIALGGFTAFVATYSLLEYLLGGARWSLDEVIVKDYLRDGAIETGRMSPLTAVCFVLLAIGLIAAGSTQRAAAGLQSLALSGTSVALLTGAALVGYLLGVDAAFGWGTYTRMSGQTGVGLFSFALALVYWSWRSGRSRSIDVMRWVPAIASVTVLGMVALGSSVSQSELENAVNWGKHSYEVLLKAQELFAQLQDVNRAAHRYAVLDEKDWLDTYNSAQAQVPQTLAELNVLTNDNPLQQARLEALSSDKSELLGYAQRLVTVHDTSGPEAATRLDNTGAGRRVMDRLRTDMQSFSSAEHALLSQRNGVAEQNFRSTGRLTVIASLMATTFLAFALFLSDREVQLRRRQQTELRLSEARFRSAFDDAPIGMALVSPAGRWLKVNRVLCDMLGYSPEDLLRQDLRSITHPDDRQTSERHMSQALASDIPAYQLEKRYLHSDGRVIFARLSLSVVRDQQGAPLYLITQVEDVTQRREMERMKDEFVSTVSHELRTPLTAIRGSLGLLAGGVLGPLSDKASSMVKIAHRNSERLVRIINDILDIEKIGAGRIELRSERIALRALLEQALEVNQAYADKFQVRLVLEPMGEDAAVVADPDRLMQVMANLLSNAAKFSPPGSTINVRASRQGQRIRVEVEDHGSGIPQQFHHRIFEKFAQADGSSSRRFEGTGLGLSITRQLLEAMGGSIGFRSTVGQGTTFHIELPGCCDEVIPAQIKQRA